MRLFWAAPLPEGLRLGCVRLQALGRAAGLRASWTAPHGLHLTLAFLGEVEDSRLGDLRAAGDSALRGANPMELRTSVLGGFPSPHRARVWWLGLESHPGLEALVQNLRRAMAVAGFPCDPKPFLPHLTLARFPLPRDIAALPIASEVVDFPIREIRLLESRQSPRSLEYHLHGRVLLDAEGTGDPPSGSLWELETRITPGGLGWESAEGHNDRVAP